MMLTVAVKMQSPCDQFLAGPAFPLDQNRAVGVGDFVNQAVNELHFPARADDILKFIFVLELLAEVNVLPAKGDDDFDHRRLVIDDYDLGHSQRGEYFTFEKKKEEIRKKLMDCHAFTMEHEPWNFADKIENCLVNVVGLCKRHSYHICQKAPLDFAELIFSA